MLRSAILSALAQVDSRPRRIEPHFVHAIRNQVGLAAEFGDPKAVVGISGKQLEESGRGMLRIARRNVQLVSGDDAELGIAEFPPELMADDGDIESGGRLRGILDCVDNPGSRQK